MLYPKSLHRAGDSLKQQVRTSTQIRAEIEEKLGFFPPFFAPAQETPEVLENLWQQTLSAYINNPLPDLFKEKLSAYLSRFCELPYCLICHSCSLSYLGMSAPEVLELLESPSPTEPEIRVQLNRLVASAPLTTWPEPNSALEDSLIFCATSIFLRLNLTEHCRKEIHRLLGTVNYNYLTSLLAYVQTCHLWVETHSEIAYAADMRVQNHLETLLAEEPGLEDFFQNYQQKIQHEQLNRENSLLVELTQHQQIEAALRESEARLRALVENLPFDCWVCDASGNYLLQNAMDIQHWGYLVGRNQAEIINASPETLGRWRQNKQRALAGEVVQDEAQYPVNGEIRNFFSILAPVRDGEEVLGILGVSMDITERKRIEQALRESEANFRVICEATPVGLLISRVRDGTILYGNRQFCLMFGFAAEEVLHRKTPDLYYDPGDRQALLQKLAQDGLLHNYEVRAKRTDGTLFWVTVALQFITFNGEKVGLSAFYDVTERKQTEIQLRQQAERDRLLSTLALQIRRSLNLEDILSTAVAEVRQFLQADRVVIYRYQSNEDTIVVAESVGHGWPSILNLTADGSWVKDRMTKYRQGKSFVIHDLQTVDFSPEIRALVAQQQVKAVLVTPILQGHQFWGVLAAHQCSEPRYWQAFEIDLLQQLATQVGIASQQSELYQQVQQLNADLETQIQDRTAQLQKAFEFEATLKRITDKVRDSLDENQILQTAVQELALGLKVGCCDTALYNLEQNTSTICYEYTVSMAASQGRVLQMADFPELYSQLLQGQYFQFCEVVANPIRSQVAMLACPIFDDQGVLGDLWLFKQKDAAFEDLEIRLVQQIANQCAIAIRQARLYQAAQTQVEKLEALNQLKDDFLSTVSHELRTPLSNIKMAIQMLKLSPNAERRQRYLEILQTECNRETDLINDLLDLQRLEATAYPTFLTEAVNLPEWIPTIVEPFRSRIQEHQQILQIDLAPNLPVLISDRANLGRILAELMNNACKYTPAKGAIALDVCCDRSSYSPLDATPRVSFIVSNEAEIPATELPRIFEKFYRIPHADPWKQGGTGLGLALVQKLVEQLKGTIAVESKDAKTVFTITLPVRPG